jgi:hypothetical protein
MKSTEKHAWRLGLTAGEEKFIRKPHAVKANITRIFQDLMRDLPHGTNIVFTAGWFIRCRNRQQLHCLKFTTEWAGSHTFAAEYFLEY